MVGVDDAGTVGAEHAQAVFADDLFNARLRRLSFRAAFGKSRRLDDDEAHALGGAVGDGRFSGFGRNDDDGQIHRPFHVPDRLVGAHTHDGVLAGIDRVEFAGEVVVDQVPENVVAQFALHVGGADHGDAGRIKEIAQALRAGRAYFFGQGRFAHEHPGVHGDVAVAVQKQRIEVQFLDFRIFHHQPRYFQQKFFQRLQIDGLPPVSLENVGAADVVDHFRRVLFGDRQNAEGNVAQHLDEHAAQAEHDQRAEAGIARHADDGFDAGSRHALHRHAFDMLVFEGFENVAVGAARLFGGGNVELDAAGVRLVDDVRRNDFHDDGEADFFADGERLVLRTGHQVAGGRDADAFEDFLAFVLHQVAAVVPDRLADHFREFIFEKSSVCPDEFLLCR